MEFFFGSGVADLRSPQNMVVFFFETVDHVFGMAFGIAYTQNRHKIEFISSTFIYISAASCHTTNDTNVCNLIFFFSCCFSVVEKRTLFWSPVYSCLLIDYLQIRPFGCRAPCISISLFTLFYNVPFGNDFLSGIFSNSLWEFIFFFETKINDWAEHKTQ